MPGAVTGWAIQPNRLLEGGVGYDVVVRIRRGRLKSTIKWGGAVLTVLLLIVWVGSAQYAFRLSTTSSSFVAIDSGAAIVAWQVKWDVPRGSMLLARPSAALKWWPLADIPPAVKTVSIPLWIPALLLGLLSAWQWCRDRKPLSNICPKCGYDRTGLPADRACPECGALVTSPPQEGEG